MNNRKTPKRRRFVAARGRHATGRARTTKAPDRRGPWCLAVAAAYFSELLIAVNLVLSVPPRVLTIVMMASEMPAAISPYSMAVAPDSSFTKRAIRFFIDGSMCTRGFELTWSCRRSQHRDHGGHPRIGELQRS